MAETDVLWPMDKQKFLNGNQKPARGLPSGDQPNGGGYDAIA